MKLSRIIFIVAAALLAHSQTDAGQTATTVTHVPAGIELLDQFNTPQKLSFPTTNITLLTMADSKGSGEIAGWVMPVKRRFDTGVDIRGIADMSCVPRPLRGLVRRQFRETQAYPVMMDWTGNVMKALAYVPGRANILVLDHQGKILYRASGKANDQSIQELCKEIGHALSASTARATAK